MEEILHHLGCRTPVQEDVFQVPAIRFLKAVGCFQLSDFDTYHFHNFMIPIPYIHIVESSNGEAALWGWTRAILIQSLPGLSWRHGNRIMERCIVSRSWWGSGWGRGRGWGKLFLMTQDLQTNIADFNHLEYIWFISNDAMSWRWTETIFLICPGNISAVLVVLKRLFWLEFLDFYEASL